MKKNKINTIKVFFLGIALIFSSCDSVLDIDAENSISGEILTNEDNIQAALLGAYVNFMGIFDGGDGGELLGGDFQLMATLLARTSVEIPWDEIEAPDYEDFIDKDINIVNLRVEANWRRAYETINTVNAILENLDNVDDASSRNRINGEALAIRGVLYFEMVRFWAPQYTTSGEASSTPGIPILLSSISDVSQIETPTKSSVAEVYTQAFNDLSQASTILSGVSTNGRLNYHACEAYLGRMALQQNDFNAAITHFNNVIDGTFTLDAATVAAFNNPTGSNENILEIIQSDASNTGNIASRTGLTAHFASIPNVGFSAFRLNPEAIFPGAEVRTLLPNNPLFPIGDERIQRFEGVNDNTEINDLPSGTAYYNNPVDVLTVSSAKFVNPNANQPIIRLAEMHLSRAEAIIEENFSSPIDATALSDLNTIRERSGLNALDNSISAQAFYDSLILERNRELLYEGIIFHDLKRWAVFQSRQIPRIGNRDPLDDRFILPIPQSECDASPGLCD